MRRDPPTPSARTPFGRHLKEASMKGAKTGAMMSCRCLGALLLTSVRPLAPPRPRPHLGPRERSPTSLLLGASSREPWGRPGG
eukprot:9447568-Pyramimonas_sp.AAC.1